MGFFRYPGGKSKLRKQIATKLKEIATGNHLEYREPFYGGGSIGLLVLEEMLELERIWINDFDSGVAALWTAVIKFPDLLKQHVKKFKPSVADFDVFKAELTDEKNPTKLISDEDFAEYGFKKLAIHQISYSGLGTKSGGPLGGRDQKSDYKIDCRWNPVYICKKIDKLTNQFSKLSVRDEKCTNLDFSKLIKDNKHDAIIYLDPPYYEKGNDLYQHGFDIEDHERLADCLRKTKHQWVLSYDDCPEIRKLYEGWSDIESLDVNYSITALKDKETEKRLSRTKVELLIRSKRSTLKNLNKGEFNVGYTGMVGCESLAGNCCNS